MSSTRPYWMSLFGHFTVLAMLMMLSALQRPEMVVGGVNIVFPPPGSGSGGGAAVAPPPEPEPPAPAPEPDPKLEPEPQEEKKGEEKKHPQPEMNVVKEPDPAGTLPPKQGDIPSERPAERDAEKAAASTPKRNTATPPSDSPEEGASGTGKAGPGGGGGIGVEGGVLGANAPWYLVQLRDKVASNWRPPASIGHTGEAKASFHFVVNADGSVAELKPVAGSNNSLYDRAAMRAILESSPLPPLPEEMGASTIGITLTFTQEY